MTDLTKLPSEELGMMKRGLEISLQYTGSQTEREDTEALIQQCEDEQRRRNQLVRDGYYQKLKENHR